MRFTGNYWFLLNLFFSLNSFCQETKSSLTTKDSVIKPVEMSGALHEVSVLSKNPISEKFSVNKLSKLNIYFNPSSSGDPLKAITILPSSTNTDESANPTLRGGSADRSRVYINGSPILNPVRNTQDNGLGSFSLFNTELIETEYVYASNPPLTFGNSSAGIVDIETNRNLSQENIQLSLALSNIGFLLGRNITKRSFIQVLMNNQSSYFFKELNRSNLPRLKSFRSTDIGVNFHHTINDRSFFNSYTYIIREKYASIKNQLSFTSEAESGQDRFFSVNNYSTSSGKSIFKCSTLADVAVQRYNFGVINSFSKYNQIFSAVSHKYLASDRLTLQYGLDYRMSFYHYDEQRPVYYYSIQSGAATYPNNQINVFNDLESYAYLNFSVSSRFGSSVAIRKNLPFSSESNFTSYQFASHYNLNKRNRFIISAGNYNSFTTPNYISHTQTLLSSKQAALDYYFEGKKIKITAAGYLKHDFGNYTISQIESVNHQRTLGLEFSCNYILNKSLSAEVGNTTVHQQFFSDGSSYPGLLNLRYYLKTQLTYYNPKFLNFSLVFATRPGNFYTKVENSTYDLDANSFRPAFSTFNSSNFASYSKFDLAINKAIQFKSNGVIVFMTLNNILNRKNQSAIFYNADYSAQNLEYYQQRVLYFGLQYRINRNSGK